MDQASPRPVYRRRPTWPVVLAALAVVAAVSAATSRAVAADPAGPSQSGDQHVFMPLVGRHMRTDRFVAPATSTPTRRATAGPSPTSGPTSTPTSTFTPTATRTPSPTSMPTAKPLDVQEDDPALQYTGPWNRVTDGRAAGGAYRSSSTVGAELRVAFTGDHLVLLRALAPDGGLATVTIDGKPMGDVTFYFFEKRYQIPAVFDNLGGGTHQLVLAVIERRPQGSTGNVVTVDAVKAPGGLVRNDVQKTALQRANFHRQAAGLTPLRGDRAIDLAAQGHADYDRRNNSVSHGETQGRPGYIGARFDQRLAYFGYPQAHGEVMYWASRLTAADAIDGWVSSVYHRLPFMDHRTTDLGYGEAAGGGMTCSVVDVGSRGSAPPPSRLITVYPANGQRDVPTSWDGHEQPEPLPGRRYPVGYPISLHIAQPAQAPTPRAAGEEGPLPGPWLSADDLRAAPGRALAPTAWRLGSAKLLDAGGREVATYVIDQANDAPRQLGPDVVFMMATSPLAANTTYSVQVSGVDSRDVAFDHRWSFTTGGAPLAVDVRIGNLDCRSPDEQVRIEQRGTGTVNLAGWQIVSTDGGETYTFPAIAMSAGAVVVVHSGRGAPADSRGHIRWTTSEVWNDAGDRAQLKDPQGAVVSQVDC